VGKSNNRNVDGDWFLTVCFFCFARGVNILDGGEYDHSCQEERC
jgi:hypothetical protein